MRYVLKRPLMISSRLMPAIHFDGGWVNLQFTGRDDDGRMETELIIETDDGEIYNGVGPSSGCWADPDIADMMASTLDFLCAEAERYRYGTDDGEGRLFNDRTAEWAYHWDDELMMLRDELEARDE